MVCREVHTGMLGGRHFHATRNADRDRFFSRGIGDRDRAKTGGRAPRIEDRIPVGLDLDSWKIFQDRAGFDGLTGIDPSIIVVVIQNIILLWVRKKNTDFISLPDGLCPGCQEIRAYLPDRPIQAVLRQLGCKPGSAQPQDDRQDTEDNH